MLKKIQNSKKFWATFPFLRNTLFFWDRGEEIPQCVRWKRSLDNFVSRNRQTTVQGSKFAGHTAESNVISYIYNFQ